MTQSNLLPYRHDLRVAIVGRVKDTVNYEKALTDMGVTSQTIMDLGPLLGYDALVLPGGGDITPAFFGQKNQGSRNIDTELDIIQLQALDLFVRQGRPVLGICKGLQIINVYFQGTVIQDLPQAPIHAWDDGDKFHSTSCVPGSILSRLYGDQCIVNSAHHQGLGDLGHGLRIIQTSEDDVVEGIVHYVVPLIGVQWHPERLFDRSASPQAVDGRLLFSYFLSLCGDAGV